MVLNGWHSLCTPVCQVLLLSLLWCRRAPGSSPDSPPPPIDCGTRRLQGLLPENKAAAGLPAGSLPRGGGLLCVRLFVDGGFHSFSFFPSWEGPSSAPREHEALRLDQDGDSFCGSGSFSTTKVTWASGIALTLEKRAERVCGEGLPPELGVRPWHIPCHGGHWAGSCSPEDRLDWSLIR